MNPWIIVAIVVGVLLICGCIVHRRVIKAIFTKSPTLKAPKWHVWVKKENRRE